MITVNSLKKVNILHVILVVLVCLMPTHRMLFDAVIKGQLDNLWRDVLLLFGFAVILVWNKGIYFGRFGVNILLMWLVCGTYLMFSDRFSLALNLARTYLIPTLIYFIIINIKDNTKFIKLLEKIFIYMGVFLAIFGMVQAFILGEEFLFALGYKSNGKYLAGNTFYISHFYGEQRVLSTFSAPNICGLYFGMVVLVLFIRMKEIKRSKMWLTIMAVGLLTTFSRSAILGTAVALLVIIVAKNIKRMRYEKSKMIKMVLFAVAAVVGFFILNYKMNGLITDMLKSSVMSIVNKTDASASKHLEDLIMPLKTIWENPFGLGFGNNGPMVLEYYKDANLVESSIYLIAYDFGIIGALIFMMPYIVCAATLVISIFRKFTSKFDGDSAEQIRDCYKIPGALAILLLVVSLLLPSLQTYEILFVFYLFLGICEIQEKSGNSKELSQYE